MRLHLVEYTIWARTSLPNATMLKVLPASRTYTSPSPSLKTILLSASRAATVSPREHPSTAAMASNINVNRATIVHPQFTLTSHETLAVLPLESGPAMLEIHHPIVHRYAMHPEAQGNWVFPRGVNDGSFYPPKGFALESLILHLGRSLFSSLPLYFLMSPQPGPVMAQRMVADRQLPVGPLLSPTRR